MCLGRYVSIISILTRHCTHSFFNIAASLLTNIIGWAIPAYFSLRALETPATGDDVQWLSASIDLRIRLRMLTSLCRSILVGVRSLDAFACNGSANRLLRMHRFGVFTLLVSLAASLALSGLHAKSDVLQECAENF